MAVLSLYVFPQKIVREMFSKFAKFAYILIQFVKMYGIFTHINPYSAEIDFSLTTKVYLRAERVKIFIMAVDP